MTIDHIKKRTLTTCGLMLATILTGCGQTTEDTAKAMELLQTLDYQGALTQFDIADVNHENERLIERGRGIAYMGLTEYDQAVTCFQNALLASDGLLQEVDYDLNYYLAAAYSKKGQPKEAEQTYTAILALRPGEQDAYFLRGSARLELSDFDGAKEDFDRVLSMDTANYDRLIEIYQALEYYGYREVGQTYLQNALEAADGKASAYDSGRIYFYLGEYQKACLALEEAKGKGGAESYLYLGKAYEATGDYNYAASVYSSYLSQDTSHAEIYNQLGLCEMSKKEYQKALEAFQAGKQIEGNSVMQSLSFNEIVAYEFLEEYGTARTLLDGYLQTYPDDEQARREQQFLLTR